MAAEPIQLDPELVEAIAQRVAELLEPRSGQGEPELVDAAELARRFGMERSWVYSHAAELGAVKLGAGPKARLRFDPQRASQALKRVGEAPQAPLPPPARRPHPRSQGGKVALLPIRRKVVPTSRVT